MPLRILSDLIEPGSSGGTVWVPDHGVGTIRELTLTEIRARAHRLAAALESYGLTPGSPGAVVASAGPHGIVATFALWCAGASVLLLDSTYSDAALSEGLGRGRVRFVLVETPVVLERILGMRPDLDALEMILLLEPPAGDRPSPALLAATAEAAGASILAEDPERIDRILRRVEADETATAGPAAKTHREFLRHVEDLRGWTGLLERDVVLLGFPFGHPDYLPAFAACLAAGASPALGRSGSYPDALGGEVSVVRPNLVLARTEAVDSLCRRYWSEVASGGFLKRKLHAWALERGAEPRRGWSYGLADRLVLRLARERFGGRLRRTAVTGGAPSGETRELHRSLGIELSGR